MYFEVVSQSMETPIHSFDSYQFNFVLSLMELEVISQWIMHEL